MVITGIFIDTMGIFFLRKSTHMALYSGFLEGKVKSLVPPGHSAGLIYKVSAHVYWTFSLNDSFTGEPNREYLSCLELEKTFVYLAVPDQSTIFLFAVFLCMAYVYVTRGRFGDLSWATGKIKQINRNVCILMCISKI